MRRFVSSVTMLVVTSVILVAVLASFAAGCGDSAEVSEGPLTLTDVDSGKDFSAAVGDTIVVVLQGNPTTGYSWIGDLDDDSAAILEQQGDPVYTEEATGENVVGSGGTFTFTFTAAGEGEATLRLIYARSWEDQAPEQTFEATVAVE